MRRIAKDPTGSGMFAWCWRYKTNQYVLDRLVDSLTEPEAIDDAIKWANTDEGEDYWDNYYEGVNPDRQEKTNIMRMIGLLAANSKPINKADWL